MVAPYFHISYYVVATLSLEQRFPNSILPRNPFEVTQKLVEQNL